MIKTDWVKIKDEYNKSSLDLNRLNQFALKTARILKENKINYSGYIEHNKQEKYFETEKYGFLNMSSRPVEKTRVIVEKREGFWPLESGRFHKSETRKGNNYYVCEETEHTIHVLSESGNLYYGIKNEYINVQSGGYSNNVKEEWEWRLMAEYEILRLDYIKERRESSRYDRERKLEIWTVSEFPGNNDKINVRAKGIGCSRRLKKLLQENGLA